MRRKTYRVVRNTPYFRRYASARGEVSLNYNNAYQMWDVWQNGSLVGRFKRKMRAAKFAERKARGG